MSKFQSYLPLILMHEGGYVNHPKDPGGATNKGITQRVYDEYRKTSGQMPQSVKNISDKEVESIYRVKYWIAIRGDDLPLGWDYAVFDFAVNSGPGRAIRLMQLALGIRDDGVIGPKTLAAFKPDPRKSFDSYMDKRREFLRSLSTFPTFGKGWLRRVEDVREYCHKLMV